MKTLIFTFVASLLLTACGQKGALYLPEKPTTAPTQTTQPTTEPAVSTDPNDY